MANTRVLTTDVEQYVREVLAARCKQSFAKRLLPLASGGTFEFDAVSADERIVASVKSSSGLTAGGRTPWGKINASLADVYYLSLVNAPVRLLVLTSREFHDIFKDKMVGRIVPEVTVECIPLPDELQLKVNAVVRKASDEVRPSARTKIIAAEVEARIT